MSKLFAFNVSESVEGTSQEGQYDSASQVWVGQGAAVAGQYVCFSTGDACGRARRKAREDGCTNNWWCFADPGNSTDFCYYNTCK